VTTVVQWGGGIPVSLVENRDSELLLQKEDARDLGNFINGLIAKTPQRPPFTEQYIGSFKKKGLAGGLRAYFYVFWTGLAAIVMFCFLAALRFSSWISIPLVIVGCFLVSFVFSASGKGVPDRPCVAPRSGRELHVCQCLN
jgi:hypothetical protein